MREFEGAEVTDFQAKLPSITVDCDDYRRGSILRLAVEVRVKGVRYEEDKKGNLVRVHVLGVESIDVMANFDPAQNASSVGGSASSVPQQTPEGAKDLGLEIGRSSDAWPGQIAVQDGKVVNTDTGEVISEEAPEGMEEGPVTDPTDEEAKQLNDLVAAASQADPGF